MVFSFARLVSANPTEASVEVDDPAIINAETGDTTAAAGVGGVAEGEPAPAPSNPAESALQSGNSEAPTAGAQTAALPAITEALCESDRGYEWSDGACVPLNEEECFARAAKLRWDGTGTVRWGSGACLDSRYDHKIGGYVNPNFAYAAALGLTAYVLVFLPLSD